MSRDIKDRLHMFTRKDAVNKLTGYLRKAINEGKIDPDAEDYKTTGVAYLNEIEDTWGKLTVKRIALTMDQIDEHQPPPNPAKLTDARATGYIAEYGDDSWELDALDPATLSALIGDEIEEVRDDDLWDEDVEQEEETRDKIRRISDHWEAVNQWLDEREAS
jgi:hypothetical protein